MPRKKAKSVAKDAAKSKQKVVNRNTQLKKTFNVNNIPNLADKTNSKKSQQNNSVNQPLIRQRNPRVVRKLNNFQCKKCFMEFPNQLTLQSHQERFLHARYPCASCGTTFSDKEQLEIHVNHAHMAVTIPGYIHKCHLCSQVFMHTAFLHAHVFHNHQQSLEEPEKCSVDQVKRSKNVEGQINEEFGRKEGGKVKTESFSELDNFACFHSHGHLGSEIEIVKTEIGSDEIITHEKYNNSLEKLENHVDNVINKYDKYRKFERDNDLRTQYSCKPCYVSVEKLSENMIPPFVCNLCNMTFPSEELKKNHITDGHIFVESVICDKKLPTQSWMRRHFRDDHSIGCDENERCACGKNMHLHEALEKHFFQHSMRSYVSITKPLTIAFKCRPFEKTEICENCGKTFWLKTCLESHTRGCSKVIDNSPDPVTLQIIPRRRIDPGPIDPNEIICHVCYAQFPSELSLLRHVQFYGRPKKYRCDICGTSFNGKSLLKDHTRDAHTFHIAYYYDCYCTICDQGFAKKIYRRIHIAHVHREKYSIKIMSTSMIDNQGAYDQDFDHDGSGRKCQVCNIHFDSREHFIEHTNYFNKETEIVCQICGQRFKGQYNAHRHYKLCHYPANVQETHQHKCSICKEGFAFRILLKSHGKHVHDKNIHGINLMRKRHNVIQNNGNPDRCSADVSSSGTGRYHMCAICEVSFPNLDLLAAHQIEYEMEGKLVCPRCGRRCGTSTLLLDHLSLNHSTAISESVKCRRCDEFFLTPAIWLSHIKHCHMSDVILPSELYLESHINFPNKLEITEIKSLPGSNKISSVPTDVQVGTQLNRKASANAEQEASEIPLLKTGTLKIKEDPNESDDTGEVLVNMPEENVVTEHSQKISSDILSAEKKWRCRTCGIDCLEADGLAKHNVTYANEGPYRCKICTRRFKSLVHYLEHKLSHNSPNVITRNYCQVCHQSFDGLTALKVHNAHFHVKNDRNPHTERLFDQSLGSLIPVCLSQANNAIACSDSIDSKWILPDDISTNIVHDKTSKLRTECTKSINNEPTDIYQCSNGAGKYESGENQREEFRLIDKSTGLNTVDTNTPAKHSDEISMCNTGLNSLTLSTVNITKKIVNESMVEFANNLFIRQPFFQCEICASVFNSKSSLESHRDNLHNITSEATEMNTLVVLTQITGMNIMNLIPVNQLNPLPKELSVQIGHEECNEAASKTVSKSCNSDSWDHLRCEPCGFVFPTLKMLSLHNRCVHSSSFPNIQCTDICNWNGHAPVPSTITDYTRHNPVLVESSRPIVRGPETLGANVEQQQPNITIQTVSKPTPMTETNIITNGMGESGSYVHDKQIKKSLVHSDAIKIDKSKSSVRSITKVMNNRKNRGVLKRKISLRNECPARLKKKKKLCVIQL